MKHLVATPLTKESFHQFGDVIEKAGSESFLINDGKCRRHHALAKAECLGDGGAVGISIFSGHPYSLPHRFNLVERHPLGSQAFYPLGKQPWLVIVFENSDGVPVNPRAFLASSDQGVNLRANTWHGVLTPLYDPSDFLVIDRVGDGDNLQEYVLPESYEVHLP